MNSLIYNKKRFIYALVIVCVILFIGILTFTLFGKFITSYDTKKDYENIAKQTLSRFEHLMRDGKFKIDSSTSFMNVYLIDAKTKKIKKIMGAKIKTYSESEIDKFIEITLKKGDSYSYKYTTNNTIDLLYLKRINSNTILGWNAAYPFQTDSFTLEEFIKWAIANLKVAFLISCIFILVFFVFVYIGYIHARYNIISKEIKLKRINMVLNRQSKALKRSVFIDSVTDLPSVFSLERDLKNFRNPRVIVLEIDDFDSTNDYYGNGAIKKLLVEMAASISSYAHKENLLVYKFSHNKFVLVDDIKDDFIDIERYENIAQDLIELFNGFNIKVINEAGQSVDLEIYCTIGFCIETNDSLKKAIIALEKAKEDGKNYLCYFQNLDFMTKYLQQIQDTQIVKEAFEKNQFVPYFQPIFDKNKKIIKYESLARIVRSQNDIVLPNVFLASSKRIKRYTKMSKILFKTCFEYLAKDPNLILSLNISFNEMMDGDMSAFVVDELSRLRVGNQVIFEVLENENIKDIERISTFIDRIKKFGVRIAIDDFGSGYSNFSNILKIKPDYLKIDGSIIKSVDTDKGSYAMLGAIVAFAKKFGIKTIAEFVHSKEVFDICVQIGVDEFQGFYLGKPSDKFVEN